MKKIDITFDTRSDSGGKDPDRASKTLKNYHHILWEKELPSGNLFSLEADIKNSYLVHKSELGEFNLTSDTIIHTYSRWKRTQNLIRNISPDKIKEFQNLGRTIGGYIVFPGNKVANLNTINQERGTNKCINDRFDLTLECIRRFYKNEGSPLYDTLKRYNDFFMLFKSFKGYCEFFFLQDLTDLDFSIVKFFIPFSEFGNHTIPKDANEYDLYRKNCIQFINLRNSRIERYDKSRELDR
jgi:hypothetical protein